MIVISGGALFCILCFWAGLLSIEEEGRIDDSRAAAARAAEWAAAAAERDDDASEEEY